MQVTIRPSRAAGTLKAPPSKSMAHRMLICAAIYAGSIDFDASLPGAFEYGEILKINV